jgi:hypothetical protein
MEFVDGGALDKFCSINRLLPMHRVIGIIFKCCLALDHAFRQGVVHRDIKPANILLDADDNPKITDFGLGLNLHKDMGKDSTFVMGVGSPAYMSPRAGQELPAQSQDRPLLARCPAVPVADRAAAVSRQQSCDAGLQDRQHGYAVGLRAEPESAAGLDPIIKKALEKDLYSRYRNGAEFAKDLSAVRYQMLEEDQTQQDLTHFESLRKLDFFVEFEDIELWEVLRISVWRELSEKVTLIREGDNHRKFGVIVDGFVEVSTNGRVICRLGSSEVVGEMAFLHPTDTLRHATVVTLEPTLFLEINSAALELSSDEVRERFNKVLLTKLLAACAKPTKCSPSWVRPPSRAALRQVGDRQGIQFHPDRQATLQFRNQVRGFRQVESTAGNKQDMIGPDHPVLGRYRGTFDERQQVALHPLTRNVHTVRVAARGDLVDFIEKDDAVLLDITDGIVFDILIIDQLRGFLLDQQPACLEDLQLARFLAAPTHVLKHALNLRGQLLHSRGCEDFGLHQRSGDIHLDLLVVQFALAQFLAKFLPSRTVFRRLRIVEEIAACRRQQGVENAVFGSVFGTYTNARHCLFTSTLDGNLDEVTDNRFDIAAHVTDLGKLGGLDLDERRVGQTCQPARDFGLANTSGSDHQDILRRDLLAQRLGDLRAPPAVAQRNRHGLLGLALTNDMFVQFVNNFLRSHRRHIIRAPRW